MNILEYASTHKKIVGLLLMVGLALSVCAGGQDSWKEEVLLHDGSKLIVERMVDRGGRHEIGQRPPIREQRLSFVMPSTNQRVIWEDRFSGDIQTASFLPMQLEIVAGIPYLVASPMGCLSYNKWGRPNPPYVIFKYDGSIWQRIALQDLPAEAKMPNLVISSPDDAAKQASHGVVSAEKIKKLNTGFTQPEYISIQRKALANLMISCPEAVFYKGAWVGPGDSIGKRMMDNRSE